MAKREEHKIWMNPLVWERLKKEAEVRGIGISEMIEALVMREVWQPNEPMPNVETTPPKYTIKQLVLKALEEFKISRNEARNYLLLHCKECNKLYLLSRYGIEPWLCDKMHKLELLGTANLFL